MLRHAIASALLVALLAAARAAGAEPVDQGSRIAGLVGWRYVPNARFEAQAREAGRPLARSSPGGPSVWAVFGYRPRLDLEVAIDVGWAYERFEPAGVPPLVLHQLPVGIGLRWAPLSLGPVYPYLGGGLAYFLNFFSGGPAGGLESHAQGPVFLVGGVFDVSDRVALVAEYRLALARAAVPGLGFAQVGGNALTVGVQVAFEPEPQRFP